MTEDVKKLYMISISDALTRKFNIRMMGTGSGRFAMEIGKTPLQKIIDSDMEYNIACLEIIGLIKTLYGLEVKKPKVINGNAMERDEQDNTIDLIITSPPYLPASSGREDYIIGKLISSTALGLTNEESTNEFLKESVGSMNNSSESNKDELPEEVIELYEWLMKDELRCIKAKPILSYYTSLKRSFKEDYRTLKKDGISIYIVGKTSTFYKSESKEVLYTVKCDEILKKIAISVGFEIIETLDVELNKKNYNARPRSMDKYYETAIIMKKTGARPTLRNK